MHLKYRIGACALLAATAVFCASYTVADLRTPAAHPAPQETSAVSDGARFTLCARNGCVAVVDPALGETAVITDIELGTLRETDRQLIEAGLPVGSRDELLSLLEDLGS